MAPRKAFLIVDDEAIIRMELADLVRDCGFEPYEAANVAEALSILDIAGASFAGLITDVQMPGSRTGMVLANHVRCMWPDIKVFIVSGGRVPMPGELPEGSAFFAKPVSRSVFSQAMMS